eukprot:SAG11_NODE_2651_length_3125_cov_2.178453_1_plen_93_part_00
MSATLAVGVAKSREATAAADGPRPMLWAQRRVVHSPCLKSAIAGTCRRSNIMLEKVRVAYYIIICVASSIHNNSYDNTPRKQEARSRDSTRF